MMEFLSPKKSQIWRDHELQVPGEMTYGKILIWKEASQSCSLGISPPWLDKLPLFFFWAWD